MANLIGNSNNFKHNILIVEDDREISFLYKTILEEAGFYVDIFNDPSQLIHHYKPNFYDLLLLDIKMPNMNGFQLFNILKERDKSIKVCFITAFEPYYQSLLEQFELDTKCFIRKPVTREELIAHIVKQLITSE